MTAPDSAPGSLPELIRGGDVHVMDGAMGTELYSHGVFVNVSYDGLNLDKPEIVERIHRDYVNAGAEIIETNTFGANPVKLSSHALADRTEEINERAVDLARRAAGGRAAVVGAIGPLGVRIEPLGPTSREEAQQYYGRQIAGLLQGGVDGFVLETFSDLNELEQAFRAVRDRSDGPVFCQITVGEDGHTAYGTSPEDAATQMDGWGADVIGLNCSVGPAVMLDAVERMARVTDRPLCAQPNAGLPRAVGDRKIYLASPEYMAQYAQRMIEAGARFVGGCCGTSPEHIRETRALVRGLRPTTRVHVGADLESDQVPVQPEVPLGERSAWGRKLADGTFVVSLEITPPKGWELDEMFAQCRRIQEAGADSVNVLDSPHAPGRMSGLPAALLIEREIGIETIVHYPCRDRNMPRMISDLLGAAAGGVRNLLLVTGRPPAHGPFPDTNPPLDIDSIGLTNVVRGLNQGVDPGGNTIGTVTRFVIGVRVNQIAAERERELSRLTWKVGAGAQFVVTQPVFAPERLEAFQARTSELSVPLVAGLRPLTSLREAEFLHNEVPGIYLPDTVLSRMAEATASGPSAAKEEGVRIALETFEAIRDSVQGVHINVPPENLEGALEILAEVRGTQGDGG